LFRGWGREETIGSPPIEARAPLKRSYDYVPKV
jgi:hypothetical protein